MRLCSVSRCSSNSFFTAPSLPTSRILVQLLDFASKICGRRTIAKRIRDWQGFFAGLSSCRLHGTDCAVVARLECNADRQEPGNDACVGEGVLRCPVG